MNIVIINGSPRKNGATAKILHAMEKHLLQKENVIWMMMQKICPKRLNVLMG